MTTAAPSSAPESPAVPGADDPHASKIAPDDPRLRIRPARGRTLKKGPALALALAAVGTVLVSLIVALLPPTKASESKKPEAEPAAAPPPPVVPDTIRNAPALAAMRPPPPTDRLLVVPLPDSGLPDELPPSESRFHAGGGGRDLRAEQELRARGAGILFEGAGRPATEPAAPPAAPATAPSASPLDRASGAGAAPADFDPNLQARKNSFLDSEGASRARDYLQASLQHPRSPYEVQAGTIVPAVLITAINSDLPGPVIGQVRENVYDTVSGNYLLIPQGARLLANYDSMVAWGQERVLVCWNRLLFPNGDSIALECMPAADLTGAAGLTDEVDEHWGRLLKGAAVASLLAATTQAVAGNTESFNPTVPQMWARGAAGEVNQVGQQVTARSLNIQPTITVRAGFSVNVLVTKDLVLPGPYALDPPVRSNRAALGHSARTSTP